MRISQLDVSKLKDATGATLDECENALVAANGDFSFALGILQENGKVKPSAVSRAPRKPRVVDANATPKDEENEAEYNLRPKRLAEYIG